MEIDRFCARPNGSVIVFIVRCSNDYTLPVNWASTPTRSTAPKPLAIMETSPIANRIKPRLPITFDPARKAESIEILIRTHGAQSVGLASAYLLIASLLDRVGLDNEVSVDQVQLTLDMIAEHYATSALNLTPADWQELVDTMIAVGKSLSGRR